MALLIALGLNTQAAAQTSTWPALQGEYLGQEPPGMEPELFGKDLVSTENFELNAVFSPDQKIFMFSRTINGTYKMFYSRLGNDGYWTAPQMAGPSKTFPNHRDVDMVFSQSQDWLYFISDRPLPGYSLDRYNIWRSRIGEFGLHDPEPLGAHINGPAHEFYPMVVGDGSLYFSAGREDSLGEFDSYRAQYRDGGFEAPVNLGPAINGPEDEGDIYVSPDEQILIHVSNGREDGYGRGDLYISFKQADGSWSQDKNMGPSFNTPQTDYCPVITPDGKYIFFSRGGDVYWADARVLEQYRDE